MTETDNRYAQALKITQDLIKCPSITPKHEGVFDVVQSALENLGFECHQMTFEEEGLDPVTNIFAKIGNGQPHFCFAGHLDVVPVGDADAWTHPPFGGEVHDKTLYGRGTSDMKGAIGAFIAAVESFLKQHHPFHGTISLLIAGDEEDPLIAGTKHVLRWLDTQNLVPDMCVVGEPTNPNTLGEMIKIGRRGSLNGVLTVKGVEGHIAYPHLADNPLPKMIDILSTMKDISFDEGSEFFQPTNLEISSIDTGNTANNVIPPACHAVFNVRFNNLHSSQDIINTIAKAVDKTGHKYHINYQITGESFFTPPGDLSDLVATAIKHTIGRRPDLTTTGGISDARFLSEYCPVVEFGGISKSMHKTDEHIHLADLNDLTDVYLNILKHIFSRDV